MITCNNDNMSASRTGNSIQKAIIELLSTIAGSTSVKDIARYQKHIDTVILYDILQPS
ncbi:hypothetical protein SDC9_151905 [bioreactor metagenome]|uniref:Uncharacterized protein n=1 Tax=bioreactor metagenome TaxID=1076179 RepID=A0A645ETB4_9ZZZZ